MVDRLIIAMYYTVVNRLRWALAYAGLGLILGLSIEGTPLGTATYALMAYGALVGFALQYTLDEFITGVVAWLAASAIGGVALNFQLTGWSAWWAPLLALGTLVVGAILGIVICALALDDESQEEDYYAYGYGVTPFA